MRVASAVGFLLCCRPSSGYLHPTKTVRAAENPPSRRRELLKSAGAALVGAAVAGVPTPGDGALALDACRANARNCIRTAWTPPAGASRAEAARDLRDVVASYPRGGQSGVDCNGWAVATDDLLGGTSSARVEYKSCVGPAAVSMNLGRPFVDDLKLEMGEDGKVQVRSSSRVGASDFGVNKKRVNYLAAALRSRGWDAPKVSYGIGSYDALF